MNIGFGSASDTILDHEPDAVCKKSTDTALAA